MDSGFRQCLAYLVNGGRTCREDAIAAMAANVRLVSRGGKTFRRFRLSVQKRASRRSIVISSKRTSGQRQSARSSVASVIWRFTARRDCLSGSTGNDHLPNKPVVHREQAIRIPPAPDASASTVTALAPAQVVVRTVSVRLMSNCSRKPVF